MKIQKDERLFLMPQQISNQLKCIICSEVFYEPMRMVCGHVFCKECIESWTIKEKKPNCPQCRKNLTKKDKPQKDFVIDSLVFELNVRCKYHPEKCGWKGSLEKYILHQNECVGDIIPEFVKKSVQSEDKEHHMEDIHFVMDPGNLMARVLGQLDRKYINIAYSMNSTKSILESNQDKIGNVKIEMPEKQEQIQDQLQKKVKLDQDIDVKLNEQLTQISDPFAFKEEKKQLEEKVDMKTNFQDENQQQQQNEQMKNLNIWEKMELKNKQKKTLNNQTK